MSSPASPSRATVSIEQRPLGDRDLEIALRHREPPPNTTRLPSRLSSLARANISLASSRRYLLFGPDMRRAHALRLERLHDLLDDDGEAGRGLVAPERLERVVVTAAACQGGRHIGREGSKTMPV